MDEGVWDLVCPPMLAPIPEGPLLVLLVQGVKVEGELAPEDEGFVAGRPVARVLEGFAPWGGLPHGFRAGGVLRSVPVESYPDPLDTAPESPSFK